MGKNKVAGANQLATGSQSGDLPTLETELHNHKEHTAAQIGELHTTLNVYQESLNAFRTEMMAEFRALRESTVAPVQPVSSTPLRLGSALPEGGATVLGALQDSAGSTHAMASSGTSSPGGNSSQNPPLVNTSVGDVEPLLQFNTSQPIITNDSGVVMNTLTVTKVTTPKPVLDKGKRVSLEKGQTSGSKSQVNGSARPHPNQIFQNANFGNQPPPYTPNCANFSQDFVQSQTAMPNFAQNQFAPNFPQNQFAPNFPQTSFVQPYTQPSFVQP